MTESAYWIEFYLNNGVSQHLTFDELEDAKDGLKLTLKDNGPEWIMLQSSNTAIHKNTISYVTWNFGINLEDENGQENNC